MKQYMFGLDSAHPRASAEKLASLGYDAVVLGSSADEHRAAHAAGLDTYLSYGAFSIGEAAPDRFGAVDAGGRPAPWFSSSCPNAHEISEKHLAQALKDARECGVKGIFVDGARFASFASPEGRASFFGCFCPRCMADMAHRGIDAEGVRRGVSRAMDFLAGTPAGDRDMDDMKCAIDTWLAYRGMVCADYFDRFAALAHASGLLACAFVFAPSLSRFVGQTADSCRSLDIVSPMLYRAYPHEEGPACLNHEWAAFRALLEKAPCGAEEAARQLFGAILLGGSDPMKGFPPGFVGSEVASARASLRTGQRLLPILQAEDASLPLVASSALAAGADGYGVFMYSQAYPVTLSPDTAQD